MSIVSKSFLIAALMACGATVMGSDAQANNGKGKLNHGYGNSHSENSLKNRIVHNDRVIIRDYMVSHKRFCPPGLAKKGNGCLPPGQAKKYRVGQVLGDDVVLLPLPRDLLAQLSPLPLGYRYVQVDKDVLLIAEASKKVIDAVTLISAIGN